jgi:hypothetical protein
MLLKLIHYKDWTWDQLISNGFSTVIQLNVWDLNRSIKWDHLFVNIIQRYSLIILVAIFVLYKFYF